MTYWRWQMMLGLIIALAFQPNAPAQQRQQRSPRIGYVYPAGGRQGDTFQVTVGGQFLSGATGAIVSGTGVQAALAQREPQISQKEYNQLKTRLAILQQQENKDAAVFREIAEIRKKISTFVNKPANPAIAETVLLRITTAPDAAPGQREIRLQTPAGLTNPLVFCIGQFPEWSEKPAETASDRKNDSASRYGKRISDAKPDAEPEITLPTVVNGQITPGDVDRYRFEARQGQHLVAAVSARNLIPYLADAVPGWFQATLTLYDAQGREVAYADDFRFQPDPVLHCEIPADGQYMIEIKDAIYRGREDFVYRITVGELPFVTDIFPLGGPAGEKTTVQLQGWNLPVAELTIGDELPDAGIYPLSVRQGEWISNELPFAVDTLPECLEQEPNGQPDDPQSIELPIIVNGRIDEPGDQDVFRFTGRAGDEIVAEVDARRLGSPLDSRLKLTDASGKELALNDDHEDKASGLSTHAADSWLSATLPADGTYYVSLADTQQAGGPEYGYRLRISPPRPDFELRIVPSTINVRGSTSEPLTVYALRKDGFSGEITLDLNGAPEGFALTNARVPAGEDQVQLTLSVPRAPGDQPVTLHVEGRATIRDRTVSHPVVPAEDMMQAFAYRHLVPAQDLKVDVSTRSASKPWQSKKAKSKKPPKKKGDPPGPGTAQAASVARRAAVSLHQSSDC